MKQILQNLRRGAIKMAILPTPQLEVGQLLIRTTCSLLSAGTERRLVEFGKDNLIAKARKHPEKVQQIFDKVQADGLLPTLDAVMKKLDEPLQLGYCSSGEIIAVSPDVNGFRVGDRVVSNGQHAEVVTVSANLCAKIPSGLPDEATAFAVISAVALQGVRLVNPTLGETVVVTGVGLIGLITVQLLNANGCRVVCIDHSPARLKLAHQFGAQTVDLSKGEDPVTSAMSYSRNRGVDAVIITATSTSSEPVSNAARMCRKRGRIVLVGVTALQLDRDEFYKKELTFQVSCSYGPGRYDSKYEDKGHDYPAGYVRWTAQRNFEAVLDMMADGRLDVKPLISHRFPFEEAEKAYELLVSGEPSLGILLEYPAREQRPDEMLLNRTVTLSTSPQPSPPAGAKDQTRQKAVVGFIGAGNYAGQILIPAFARTDATLHTLATIGGISGVHVGRRHGFHQATTDTTGLLAEPAVNSIVIATRHNTHTRFVCEALQAGKHVFVEKPLCLTLEELVDIAALYERLQADGKAPLFMVGFNRRFSPQIQRIRQLLEELKGPRSFVMTVNAGMIPTDHWTQDPAVGGGRIIGEACHFVDLLRFLAGTSIQGYQVAFMDGQHRDVATFTFQFADGSVGTVHYLANGHRSFPKERLEVFCAGRILQLDNFRKLRGYGWPGFRKMNLWRQDKGQNACAAAFVEAIRTGGAAPIPVEEIFEVSRVTIEISQQRHHPLP